MSSNSGTPPIDYRSSPNPHLNNESPTMSENGNPIGIPDLKPYSQEEIVPTPPSSPGRSSVNSFNREIGDENSTYPYIRTIFCVAKIVMSLLAIKNKACQRHRKIINGSLNALSTGIEVLYYKEYYFIFNNVASFGSQFIPSGLYSSLIVDINGEVMNAMMFFQKNK